jgi:hypothetical protein
MKKSILAVVLAEVILILLANAIWQTYQGNSPWTFSKFKIERVTELEPVAGLVETDVPAEVPVAVAVSNDTLKVDTLKVVK